MSQQNIQISNKIINYSLKINVWKFKNVKRAIEKVFVGHFWPAGLTLAAPDLNLTIVTRDTCPSLVGYYLNVCYSDVRYANPTKLNDIFSILPTCLTIKRPRCKVLVRLFSLDPLHAAFNTDRPLQRLPNKMRQN